MVAARGWAVAAGRGWVGEGVRGWGLEGARGMAVEGWGARRRRGVRRQRGRALFPSKRQGFGRGRREAAHMKAEGNRAGKHNITHSVHSAPRKGTEQHPRERSQAHHDNHAPAHLSCCLRLCASNSRAAASQGWGGVVMVVLGVARVRRRRICVSSAGSGSYAAGSAQPCSIAVEFTALASASLPPPHTPPPHTTPT